MVLYNIAPGPRVVWPSARSRGAISHIGTIPYLKPKGFTTCRHARARHVICMSSVAMPDCTHSLTHSLLRCDREVQVIFQVPAGVTMSGWV